MLGDKKAVKTKVQSRTEARGAGSVVEREGDYSWLSINAVKKAARFLCTCSGKLTRMVEQDTGH